jgi:recombination protein RecT
MSPSAEIVPYQQKVKSVRTLLERSRGQIALALPSHLTADRMIRVALTCVQRNPLLLDCTEISLVGAIIQASQLGLMPDGHGARAYLIPRRNNKKGVIEANFQPGFQGLMDLARRSKEIASFEAREVYAGDRFEYAFGLHPKLVHVPSGEDDEAKITHVYAVCQLLNGHGQFDVLTREQIEAHRKRYAKDTRDDSAWKTAWPMMAKKTVIIRLCKYLPASVELQAAVALAEKDDMGLPQELGVIEGAELVGASNGGGSTLDKLADKLAGQSDAPPDPEALKAEIEAARVALGYEGKVWEGIVKEHAGVSLGYADADQLTKLRDYLVALMPKG